MRTLPTTHPPGRVASAWRVAAVIVSGLIVCSLPGTPAAAAAPRASLAANGRAARRDATGLLTRVRLPARARRVGTEPGGGGGSLAAPAIRSAGTKLIDRFGWWTVPASEASVYAFVLSHAPAGSKAVASGNSSGPPDRTGSFVVFAFGRGAYVPARELVIDVVALPSGATGVRADAEVQWIVPRPPGERIPVTAHVIDVTVAAPGRAPVVDRHITDVAQVQQLAAMIDRLPTVQPEAIDCPSYPVDAPVVTFTFRPAPGGVVLARAAEPAYATAPTTPCDPMTLEIAGRTWTPLLGGPAVVAAAQRMLRVQLTRSG